MGKRGPKPTPTQILKLRGSRRADSRGDEPNPATGVPDCPAWLSPSARGVWDQVAPKLEAVGVLTCLDENALARYCHLFVRWRAAEDNIAEHGETYELLTEKGEVKYTQQRPQVGIASKLSESLRRLEADFGMTPAARSSIKVDSQSSPRSELDDFLTGQLSG